MLIAGAGGLKLDLRLNRVAKHTDIAIAPRLRGDPVQDLVCLARPDGRVLRQPPKGGAGARPLDYDHGIAGVQHLP